MKITNLDKQNTTLMKYKITLLINKTPLKNKIPILINKTPLKYVITMLINKKPMKQHKTTPANHKIIVVIKKPKPVKHKIEMLIQ
jgi:hypothetical protein